MCKERKFPKWISIRKNGFSYCGRSEQQYEKIRKSWNWELYSLSKIVHRFFFIGESISRLHLKVVSCGCVGIDENVVGPPRIGPLQAQGQKCWHQALDTFECYSLWNKKKWRYVIFDSRKRVFTCEEEKRFVMTWSTTQVNN